MHQIKNHASKMAVKPTTTTTTKILIRKKIKKNTATNK
jgi:hypothetical protein